MEDKLRDILKTRDVNLAEMLVKVYDTNTGKEGWLDVQEIFNNLIKAVEEVSGQGQQIKKVEDGVSPSSSLEPRSTAEEDNTVKRMTVSADNQSADSRQGCGKFVDGTLQEYIDGRIVGHDCIGDCPECKAKIQKSRHGRGYKDTAIETISSENPADTLRGWGIKLSPQAKEELEQLKKDLDLPPIAEKIICRTPTEEFLRLEKENGNDILARNPQNKVDAGKDICPTHQCERVLPPILGEERYCPSCKEELNLKQELETAEILADEDCMESIRKSLQEFREGKVISLKDLDTFNPCQCEEDFVCANCLSNSERHYMVEDDICAKQSLNMEVENKGCGCRSPGGLICGGEHDWLCPTCDKETSNAKKTLEVEDDC